MPEAVQGPLPALQMEPRHWDIVRRILAEQLPGCEVWAFGSRARGAAKPHSDLDLAIVTDEPLPWVKAAALQEAFSQSDLPWRVDVVDWASTSEAFRRLIESHRVVVQAAASA
ncbi:MAG: nucleotidyltransferase domain-containing protein [Burkholderiales bacterium]|nr:nucleotidyltransferase domain-containing protein [Burkholderiales bacterium]